MATVFERVRDIAADKLSVEPDDIQLESSFTEDLEADSLDVVELIMALEEEFGGEDDSPLEISDEDSPKSPFCLGFRFFGDFDKFDFGDLTFFSIMNWRV